MSKKDQFQIFDKQRIEKSWGNQEEHSKEYRKHIGYGSSGMYNTTSKKGYIFSFLKTCKELEGKGYRNLNFCNGGDDDWLVVDHVNKTFGFFEDYYPSENVLKTYDNLKQVWEKY